MAPALDGLREEIVRLNARLDRLTAEPVERRPSQRDVDTLRSEVSAMARSLADLAPRNAGVALEGAVGDLGQRLNAARRAGAGDDILAPIENMLRQVMDALRKHDPEAAAHGLERELRALAGKIEALTRAVVNPAALDDIRRQTEEVRAMLSAAASKSVPTDRLERQIGQLADRIERLGTSAAPRAETAEVVEMLAQTRATIERAASPAMLQSIERRLEQLAQKMDAALQREPAPAPSIDRQPLEDLALRLDSVKASLEQQAQFAPRAARLEAALTGLTAKIDNPANDAGEQVALHSALRALTDKLEGAIQTNGRSAAIDASVIADLAQRIDGARATVERQGDVRPDIARLESALREISQKLDRSPAPPPTPPDNRGIIDAVQNLAERIDRRPAVTVDTTPIEALIRNFNPPPPPAVDMTPIETMLREFSERFAPVANEAMNVRAMQDLLNRVDARLQTVDTQPIERALGQVLQKLEFAEPAALDDRQIEDAAEIIARRLEHRAGPAIDTDALVNQISEIHARLDNLGAGAPAQGALERTVAELVNELEAIRGLVQTSAAGPDTHPLLEDLAELKAEQSNSERRMAARLASVQDILETLAERLKRIEEGDEPEFAAAPPSAPASAPMAAAMPSPREPAAAEAAPVIVAPRAPSQPPAAARPIDDLSLLLEPGSGLPRAKPATASAAPAQGGVSAIHAHIAAARRAAMAEMAAKRDQTAEASEGVASKFGISLDSLKRAQALVAGRRVPFLIGAVILAFAATVAIVELRSGRSAPVQKSEAPPIVQPANPVAQAEPPVAPSVDYSTTGAIDSSGATKAAAPRASAPPLDIGAAPAHPAPADLVAGLPADLGARLREAAAAGDPTAETEIGLRYLDGRTLARDPKIAARWLETAATQGLPIAQYRIAALYEKGTGVARDTQLARAWYAKAAAAGNARAMHNLAVLNAEDAGAGKPDYAAAADGFKRAAALGVRDSQFNLGILYGRGLGVAQDLSQSWMWFSVAAQQGDADAAKKRDEVAAKMDPKALAAAQKALAQFKPATPSPAANELAAPAGGWDGGSNGGSPQAAQPSQPSPSPAAPAKATGA